MRRAVKRSSKRARTRCRGSLASWPTAPTAPVWSSTMKPVSPSSMISGTEPRLNAITGVPHAIASIIVRPNGSGQSIETRRADRPAEEIRFLSIVDLVNIVDERETHQRLDLLFEIVAIDLVDLGCNLDRQSGALGNTDGAVDAFLRRNATEKRKIVWLHRLRRQQLRGQTVIDRLDPAGLRHGPALRVRYRDHRYRRERREHRLKLRQIEPSM